MKPVQQSGLVVSKDKRSQIQELSLLPVFIRFFIFPAEFCLVFGNENKNVDTQQLKSHGKNS